jgi:hypothetical protein
MQKSYVAHVTSETRTATNNSNVLRFFTRLRFAREPRRNTAACVCVCLFVFARKRPVLTGKCWVKSIWYVYCFTRWFKYDREWLCVNKSQFVAVIFNHLVFTGTKSLTNRPRMKWEKAFTSLVSAGKFIYLQIMVLASMRQKLQVSTFFKYMWASPMWQTACCLKSASHVHPACTRNSVSKALWHSKIFVLKTFIAAENERCCKDLVLCHQLWRISPRFWRNSSQLATPTLTPASQSAIAEICDRSQAWRKCLDVSILVECAVVSITCQCTRLVPNRR